MFGYINIVKDELKVKEYNLFKAYYCGLCQRQGKLLGQLSRLSLSYDFATLAVLLDGVLGQPSLNGAKRCAYNPLKKHALAGRNEVLDYCASMSVALTYFKLKDDANDEKSLLYKLLATFYSIPAKKVEKVYPKKILFIKECLNELSALEKEHCTNIDRLAQTSGQLMSEIFQPPFDIPIQTRRILKQVGHELGHWLYILDAIDDFEEDKKKNRFNPFANKEIALESEKPMWYNLSSACKAYELIDLISNKSIMDNIMYCGLHTSTQKVLNKLIIKD